MWAICCSCSKSEESAKVDATPAANKRLTVGGRGASESKEERSTDKKKTRLTMVDQRESAINDEEAPMTEKQSELPEAPVAEGANLPTVTTFPSAKNLVKEVQRPDQIFSIAPHEFCIFGSSTQLRGTQAQIEPEYEEKKLEISGADTPDALRKELQKQGVAVHCKKGKKPEQPNQDNVLLCKMGDFTICGVADGHGPDGHWASHWTARYILRLVMAEVSAAGRLPGDEALTRIFDIAHQGLQFRAADDRFDLNMSGSTLSVCIVDHSKKHVVAAWVGDSRCAICRPGGKKGQSLTADHKPQDKVERARIKARGGEVVAPGEHDVPYRVFVAGGQVPGLAMSRAMGDMIAHSVGVIHEPGIVRYKLEDHCVLCCSDGVWEFIESAEAGAMVSKGGRKKVVDVTDGLCKESRDRWLKEEEFITDDISAISVWI